MIYGTGKWARLLGAKLQQHDLYPIHIGSDDSLALFNRGDKPSIVKGRPVYIASKTQYHFADFVDCLSHDPKEIFIEKGFCSNEERLEAKKLAGNIPVYFLSQYRFSAIFEKFKAYDETIVDVKYTWHVEQYHAQEWLYHIVSIDNYIKGTDNFLYVNDYGSYFLDGISQVNINKSAERSCVIELDTDVSNYVIRLGKNNEIQKDTWSIAVSNEDCLSKQISSIIENRKEKLERL